MSKRSGKVRREPNHGKLESVTFMDSIRWDEVQRHAWNVTEECMRSRTLICAILSKNNAPISITAEEISNLKDGTGFRVDIDRDGNYTLTLERDIP